MPREFSSPEFERLWREDMEDDAREAAEQAEYDDIEVDGDEPDDGDE